MQLQVIERTKHSISRKNIDADALSVLYKLFRAGHTAYLVGGGVRDMLLHRTPKDFDVVTSARPAQIKKLFRRSCHLIGRRFRLAHVRFGREKIIEVSTFRREPDIESGLREGVVGSIAADDGYICSDNAFGTPEQDALRRDFTINSIFYNIADYTLLDYCGGLRDLQDRVIRTIGDPQVRFREDPVRMIRAIKFCARLGFNMDANTWQGIIDNCQAISNASEARVQEEILRLLESRCSKRCFELLEDSGMLKAIVPELYEYLQRAKEGNAPEDPHGEMLWIILGNVDELNQASDSFSTKEEARLFAAGAIMLPLVLEAGLLRNYDYATMRAIVDKMGQRVGMCNRLKDAVCRRFMVMSRLISARFERDEAQLFRQEAFNHGFKYYAMLVQCGISSPSVKERWESKWNASPLSTRDVPDKDADYAYRQKREKKRSKHRKGGRRRSAAKS